MFIFKTRYYTENFLYVNESRPNNPRPESHYRRPASYYFDRTVRHCKYEDEEGFNDLFNTISFTQQPWKLKDIRRRREN